MKPMLTLILLRAMGPYDLLLMLDYLSRVKCQKCGSKKGTNTHFKKLNYSKVEQHKKAAISRVSNSPLAI